jgi:hypothetical protein
VFVSVPCAAWVLAILRQWFMEEEIGSFARYGLELERIAYLIDQTIKAGGRISGPTRCLPAWIQLFERDSDGWFLITGAAYGFSFPHVEWGDHAFFRVPNYVQEDHVERVSAQIDHERAEGRIVAAVAGYIGISAIGSVLKQGGPKIRVVHDYSRPSESGVNAHVTPRRETFAGVRDAAGMLRPGALHCKVDITEAYRALPMEPEWWKRHVFEWDGVVYSDLRMPFGSSGAPSAFHRFSAAFARAVKAHGFPAVVPFLDDFWLSA